MSFFNFFDLVGMHFRPPIEKSAVQQAMPYFVHINAEKW
jgi:hypothetical protein